MRVEKHPTPMKNKKSKLNVKKTKILVKRAVKRIRAKKSKAKRSR